MNVPLPPKEGRTQGSAFFRSITHLLSPLKRPGVLLCLIIVVIFAADFITKHVALNRLASMGVVPLFEFAGFSAHFQLTTNSGIAWGLAQGHLSILLVVRVCFLLGIAWFLLRKRPPHLESYCWASIYAGGVANLFDMFQHNCVLDFIALNFWGWAFPIFNIADSAVTLGVLGLFYLYMRGVSDEA